MEGSFKKWKLNPFRDDFKPNLRDFGKYENDPLNLSQKPV